MAARLPIGVPVDGVYSGIALCLMTAASVAAFVSGSSVPILGTLLALVFIAAAINGMTGGGGGGGNSSHRGKKPRCGSRRRRR